MIVEEIIYIQPEKIANLFSNNIGTLWLDSAVNTCNMGRSSFIAISPYDIWSLKSAQLIDINNLTQDCLDPFSLLQEKMKNHIEEHNSNLPGFQTGVAGLLSYNFHSYIEPIRSGCLQSDPFPDLYLGFYDLVISYDHLENKCYLFSNGAPETDKLRKNKRAVQRIKWLKNKISNLPEQTSISEISCTDFSTYLSKEQYLKDIQSVIDYIYAGDIFEANLSQKFTCQKPEELSYFDLYRRLRSYNPAPFSALLNTGKQQILSSSPERFLYLNDKIVEARPIKGTMPRSDDPIIDQENAQILLNSEKDHAENTMIVDLMRNDISRVCIPGSVNVPKLCGLESFKSVHHLVSVVQGKLLNNKNAIDLLKCCFPGGSITGAPKIRSMEIIYELERMTRGPYCGSIFYLSNTEAMDSSILIRTILCDGNNISFRTGGAIVSDSKPESEYQETLDKATKLKEALLAI